MNGPGYPDQMLAVKSRKNTQKSAFVIKRNYYYYYYFAIPSSYVKI